MTANRPLALIAGSLLTAATFTSCNDEAKEAAKKAEQALTEKEIEVEDLQSEVRKLKKSVEESKTAGEKADAAQKDLEQSRQEAEALKEELEKLRKENDKLKREATVKIRDRAVGEKHEEITGSNGKVYRQVTIRKVDDNGVAIAHESGMSTLNEGTAPAAWVTRFRLDQKPPEPEVAAAPATPPAAPATAPKSSGKAAKNEVVRAKLPGVLIVEGAKSKGSGFLAVQDGVTYLYTAAHVLTSGKITSVRNHEGAELSGFGRCQVAVDCDLARIEVNVKSGLALSLLAPGTAAVGQEIVAVGNSGGSGVLPLLDGKITALGPKEVEVSAAVIQGNSGGPVFSAATGEVIGAVCRAEAGRDDIWSSGTSFSKIRRFASRLDRPVQWRTTALETLQTENDRITTFDSRTQLVFAMAALEPGQNGLRLDTQLGGGKGPTILSIFEQHKNVATVQRLMQMNRQLADRQLRSSERDLKKRFAGFYHDTLRLFANDASNFEPENFSFVNRKEAELSLKWRKEAVQLLTSAANAVTR